MVKITQKFMTQNDCYKKNGKLTIKGIMVHSTATPGVMAEQWFSRWNKPGVQACVHAFVDHLGVMQYLPWTMRGWHGGKSASNDTLIGFEICEPKGHTYSGGSTMYNYNVKANEDYFNKAYNNAVDLCVYLCKQYGLTEKDIISHREGYLKGIATNHGDPNHWFPKHNKSMDTFRADVKAKLNGVISPVTSTIATLEQAKKYVGTRVKELQSLLIELGYKCGNGLVDGSFGNGTYQSLIQFQKDYKLKVDAYAGTETFGKLNELVNAKRKAQEDERLRKEAEEKARREAEERAKKKPSGDNTGWRVICGYFEDYDNAMKVITQLKEKGFNAYLVEHKK